MEKSALASPVRDIPDEDAWVAGLVMGGRRRALLPVGAALCAALAGCADRKAPPNVLLITLDTTRADRLGCYGNPDGLTPNLDRLAARSTVFLDAISSASVTPVSHATILTGLFPYHHGLRVLHGTEEYRLPDEATTLAESLAARDYRTAAFVSAFPAGSRFGLQQGFETFSEEYLVTPVDRIVSTAGTVSTGPNQQHAGRTTDLALSWLEGVDDRFFLWLHYFDPHDGRVHPPKDYLEPHIPIRGDAPTVSRTMYDLEVRYMDSQIGRVLDALEQDGRMENTIVVVVSDHGESLGDHDWWTHGLLYQEQIRVALIVYSGRDGSARTVPHLVRTADVLPTVLELVGETPAAPLDGESLVPLLTTDAPDPGHVAYADALAMLQYDVFLFPRGSTDNKTDVLYAVSDGRWKYIHHVLRGDESELYDLAADPKELVDLYAERPDQVARLLADLHSRPFAPRADSMVQPMSEEDLERLRSLGYVQ